MDAKTAEIFTHNKPKSRIQMPKQVIVGRLLRLWIYTVQKNDDSTMEFKFSHAKKNKKNMGNEGKANYKCVMAFSKFYWQFCNTMFPEIL